jgi:hypothetical protein
MLANQFLETLKGRPDTETLMGSDFPILSPFVFRSCCFHIYLAFPVELRKQITITLSILTDILKAGKVKPVTVSLEIIRNFVNLGLLTDV